MVQLTLNRYEPFTYWVTKTDDFTWPTNYLDGLIIISFDQTGTDWLDQGPFRAVLDFRRGQLLKAELKLPVTNWCLAEESYQVDKPLIKTHRQNYQTDAWGRVEGLYNLNKNLPDCQAVQALACEQPSLPDHRGCSGGHFQWQPDHLVACKQGLTMSQLTCPPSLVQPKVTTDGHLSLPKWLSYNFDLRLEHCLYGLFEVVYLPITTATNYKQDFQEELAKADCQAFRCLVQDRELLVVIHSLGQPLQVLTYPKQGIPSFYVGRAQKWPRPPKPGSLLINGLVVARLDLDNLSLKPNLANCNKVERSPGFQKKVKYATLTQRLIAELEALTTGTGHYRQPWRQLD